MKDDRRVADHGTASLITSSLHYLITFLEPPCPM